MKRTTEERDTVPENNPAPDEMSRLKNAVRLNCEML
jgi:hypothetical protein